MKDERRAVWMEYLMAAQMALKWVSLKAPWKAVMKDF